MSQNIKDEFLDKVIEQIQFKPDRNKVRQELEDHIEDKLEYQSLEESIDELGNPIEIGESLNEIHNPFIGRLWMVSRLVLLISILIGTQFIYKEYEDKNDFIKSAYPYEGNQYTKNNQFEKLKYEKNGVNYTVEIMKDTSNADAILFISRSNMFDLNFDDLSAAIIKVEGITNNFQNFYSYNGIPDFYASIFILDSNLKGDEKIELITKENLFTLEGKLK